MTWSLIFTLLFFVALLVSYSSAIHFMSFLSCRIKGIQHLLLMKTYVIINLKIKDHLRVLTSNTEDTCGSAFAFWKETQLQDVEELKTTTLLRIRLWWHQHSKPTLSIGKGSPLLHTMGPCLCSMCSPGTIGFGSRFFSGIRPGLLYISYRQRRSQFTNQKQARHQTDQCTTQIMVGI